MSNPGEHGPKTEITPATNEELDMFVNDAGQLFIDAQNQAMQDLGFDDDPRELEAVSVKVGPTELERFNTLRSSGSAEVIFVPPTYDEQLPLDHPHQPAEPATLIALTVSREKPESQEPTVHTLQVTPSINSQPAHVWNASDVHLAGPARSNVESYYTGHDSFQDAVDAQKVEDLYKQVQGDASTQVAQSELQDWLGLLKGVVRPERLNFPAAEYRPEPTINEFIGLIR